MTKTQHRQQRLLSLAESLPEYEADPILMFRDFMLLGMLGRLQMGEDAAIIQADAQNIGQVSACLQHAESEVDA